MSEGQSCVRVIFQGRVQGVGFRYTTNRIAKRHAVTGFVRNLSDGTVELFACGEESARRQFVDDVREHFATNITAAEEESADAERFAGFDIRY